MSNEILEQKKKEVAGITDRVKRAKGVVVIDYRGLTVAEDTELRNKLRAEKIEYKVLKNRLVLRALNDAGYKGFDKVLEGPTAVAFGYDDAIAPAKILVEAAAKLNKTKVKAGIFEGKIADENMVKAYAKIPAKTTLIAQLLGLLTSPARSLAVALNEVAKKKA